MPEIQYMDHGVTTERNVGIDALRIFSMFLVVILHVLGHGGILDSSSGVSHSVLYLLEIVALCAVDIFAMVSGYVGYSDIPKTFKSSRVIKIWVQVFFYSFLITLIAYCLKFEGIGLKTLIRSAFPVASNQYWYFSCYFPVLILSPWLNHFLRSLNKKQSTCVALTLVLLFSVYYLFVGRLSPADPFVLGWGYSAIWLMILYLLGGWMKKCHIDDLISAKWAWIAIICSVLITWIFSTILSGFLAIGVLKEYISITIVICAFSWLVIFSKMKPGQFIKKCIMFFAPAAFGVYLIHDNNIIRKFFMTDSFVWVLDKSVYLQPLIVIGLAVGILISCLCIEKFRLFLFKLLKINHLLHFIGDKIDFAIHGISEIIQKQLN